MTGMQIAGVMLLAGFWAALIAFGYYLQKAGKPTTHTLLEYQRGILYHCGQPTKELGSGRHRLWVGRDYLLYLDMRPKSFTRELAMVATRDGQTAVYALSGKFQVRDLKKAIYCARDNNQAAIALIASIVRSKLNDSSSEDIRLHSAEVCNGIVQVVRERAHSIGMEILELRFSQLAIAQQSPLATAAPGQSGD
jgi:regulator of protease activity HflC (stomatin/prohibitin superfamily)